MGRGHESEVRINDISVSRVHAILKCKEDGFYLEDNTSKFGTIVLLREKYFLNVEHTLAVQVGRTVVSFTTRLVDIEKYTRIDLFITNFNRQKQERQMRALEYKAAP